ncbi:aminotransferase class I/II-fold pyridoxal phosphate-dependent enzyme [Ruminococcus sp.]|uniref:trans-sulfuration enzyme family protein n=2 Tax=Ruminococcus sp. TaxID=41978 RepID=UPI002C8DD63A|nr:aminotransferase class I/II-fold pyridoxal phosphate-dependent enzyme [Ruminococcus sp.]HNZ99648.1 aminotransferase class I/II-fold pyridoxal phosphate-dependent enzyme [Ruminococcus sp.]
MSRFNNTETALIHGGISIDERTGAVNIPIYQTSTYKQDGLGKMRGYEYSRTGNPTREALEALIAELEGGYAGFAFGSGMAALTAVLSLLHSGDRVLISSNVYGGTFRLLSKVFDHFSITYTISDTTDLASFESDIAEDVKAVIIESPANPLMTVTDIRAVAEVSHRHGLLVIVDNTFMTPYLQKPLELGADIVVHSATKYLGGHSDVVSGLAVVNSAELAEKIAFIQNSTGGVLGPFDSFLLIRGIKTLAVRMDRHVYNAEKAAQFLSEHDAVKNVYYPGLPGSQGYEVNLRQAKNGGAMISFELKDNYDINTFFENLQLVSLAESLGGVESLVCHPSSMTHASIPADIRKKVGITDGLIRLSVGIEQINDILGDIAQAIAKAERK